MVLLLERYVFGQIPTERLSLKRYFPVAEFLLLLLRSCAKTARISASLSPASGLAVGCGFSGASEAAAGDGGEATVGGAATVGGGTELTGVDVPGTALAGGIVGTGEGGGVDNEGVGGEGGRVELFGVSGVVEAAEEVFS